MGCFGGLPSQTRPKRQPHGSKQPPSPPLPLPQISILSALYIATGALSEILTNNAAAALMYPIASVAGERLGERACWCVCTYVCFH